MNCDDISVMHEERERKGGRPCSCFLWSGKRNTRLLPLRDRPEMRRGGRAMRGKEGRAEGRRPFCRAKRPLTKLLKISGTLFG